ncbi:MAG: hypothetical protein K6G55_06555 [Selenomonadaceae bacterium]|nr:hypothetical protein [Selenomonadaceae bacterium]
MENNFEEFRNFCEEKFKQLADEVKELRERLNKLEGNDTPEYCPPDKNLSDDERNNLNGTIESLRTERAKLNSIINSLRTELDDTKNNFENERNNLNGTIESLRTERAKLNSIIDGLRTELDDTENNFEDERKKLNGTIDGLRTELDDTKNNFENERENLNGTIDGLRRELDDTKNKFADERDNLNGTIDGLRTELDDTKNKFADERKNLKDTINNLRKERDNAQTEADYYRETYRKLDEAYKLYMTLDEDTRDNLAGVFGKGDNPTTFFSGAVQESHLATFWDYVSRRTDNETLHKLFDFCFDALNCGCRDANYIRLDVSEGESFDDETMRRTSSSRQMGKVARVCFQGYRYAKGKVVKQTVVELN